MSSSKPNQASGAVNYASARFLKSAKTLDQCGPDEGAEIAFAGRSNAGKSSAINRLTRQKKLARTSKTPGRTQLINFFGIGDGSIRLVDLPGYGYAKVPQAVKREWEENLSEYLNLRQSIKGCVLLMDIRHPLQEFDRNFIAWTHASELPLHALLTKSDKLKRGAATNTLLKVEKEVRQLGLDEYFSIQLFSSSNGNGLEQLQETLSAWVT